MVTNIDSEIDKCLRALRYYDSVKGCEAHYYTLKQRLNKLLAIRGFSDKSSGASSV